MRLDRRMAALFVAPILFLGALFLAGGAPAQSDAGGVFVVTVPVDATAQSAVAAREKARAEGERQAYRQLLERLTLPADRGRLPKVDAATLTAMVQDISVANERSSAVRYLADYTYRFRPDAVRRQLRAAGIPFAETPSKPVVVLPVFRSGGQAVLWDDPNPWRAAWATAKPAGGLVPVTVPPGDLTDLAEVDAAKATSGDAKALGDIAQRYGGGDPVVSVATAQGEGDQPSAVGVSTTRYGAAPAGPITQTVRANPGESEADLLARAVAGAKQALEDAWKQQTILRFGEENALVVAVPLHGLEDWVAVRDRLGRVAAVRRADLVSLNKEEARVELHYLGDPAQLRLALAQRDLVLAEAQPLWTLRPRGSTR